MTTREIKSPIPGVFYRKPAPDSPPFKQDGDDVSPNDVIGMVEVMKSFHEITAETGGKSIRFLVDDADEVMAGQTLAEIQE
jgi:biotin carboxyl carrier protein